MKVRIRGEDWDIRTAPIAPGRDGSVYLGMCYPRTNRIRIAPGLTERQELGITCHEVVHACDVDLSEEAVIEYEKALTDVLWKRGWRKVAESK